MIDDQVIKIIYWTGWIPANYCFKSISILNTMMMHTGLQI